MNHKQLLAVIALAIIALCAAEACKKESNSTPATSGTNTNLGMSTTTPATAVQTTFGSNIDLNNLENYAAQAIPAYINRDNGRANPITNKGATLGRVLFYDKALSVNNTIACGSCHKQDLAFGDNVLQSIGVNGLTTRHSMRLVNARFAQEVSFFWDKRAATLEDQTTQPIQNHNEMGYSGQNGDPDITALVARLQGIGYYKQLFAFVYGDATVTEARIQLALAQFIRSIQSFDSRFDAGMASVNNINADFPNFTTQENLGKSLFINPPSPPGTVVTGAGCQTCHRAPTFDIDPNSRNNGVIGVAGSTTLIDITNTNPPSLRNVVNAAGRPNGMYMHNAAFGNLQGVIDHYNQIPFDARNTNLDNRLFRGTQGQTLRLSQAQKDAIIAFLGTLSGNDVYTNKKWGNPFVTN
ncbi:cytochrome-c peroxidase [Mucilaginibacter mali]|uniref:Cytochrome-c peroxidase n=1 Tax=Mucilaginibacter mali TaxID=2740462 RepID=A0A7D4TPI5_9SPHI|nr:cytochrome c peroxidase [Mucilaginibacter mali]QKJ30794.1 cytochrome-c peroxidase [Mucilaginibacter mali]